MKDSYISRISYKSLKYSNPMLGKTQLKSESLKVIEKHKSRLNIKDKTFTFDPFYLKKWKQSNKFISKSLKTSLTNGIGFDLISYSGVFPAESTQTISNHPAWVDNKTGRVQQKFSHILLSKEKIEKGSQLDKYQQRFKK